jgi:hypothetical protein
MINSQKTYLRLYYLIILIIILQNKLKKAINQLYVYAEFCQIYLLLLFN